MLAVCKVAKSSDVC